MARINVLPKNVAELIAAGEVVERPSSVVKELIENSLDAGADSITVEIKGGGIRYIRVTDNGCGIYKEDVKKAFISHATSKIKDSSDLDEIFTLGFRGEALPSVAAVSRLSLLTRTADEEEGTAIEIEGGEEKAFGEAGCPPGTTIIIRDLFYNTPARMKFLKKDSTEGNYVSDVTAKAAISHPEVRFSLIKDGKQVLQTPGNGDLLACIYSVFGKEISSSLIECEGETAAIKVRGFISRPLSNRPNRNLQYCYVNGRYVRVPVAAAALDEAYKNRIMVGKFPVCFLFIDIPHGKTDVNVHPAKTEIRFSEDSKVFEAIFYAAKAALNKGDNLRPEARLQDKKNVLEKSLPGGVQLGFGNIKDKTEESPPKTYNDRNSRDIPKRASEQGYSESEIARARDITENVFRENKGQEIGVFRDTSVVFENAISSEKARQENIRLLQQERKRVEENIRAGAYGIASAPLPADKNDEKPQEKKSFTPESFAGLSEKEEASDTLIPEEEDSFIITGEIFGTYILVEKKDRLLIIDKHAAHERMIFDSLMKDGFCGDSQMLLSPVTVTLTSKEYAAVTADAELFRRGGFTIEDFGGSSVIVRDCPVALDREDIVSVITEMAGELLRGNRKPMPEKLEKLYHSTACRRAIKAGDEMKKEETEGFVRQLLKDDSIRYCPHGRPVMYELTKREIEKQFGRIQ